MNFKKTTSLIILLFIVLSASVHADNGLLWRVSGNGLEKPSYLFGTHHLALLSFLESVNGLNEAFDATEQTVGEVDIANMGADFQMKLMQQAMMPEGVTYESLLSADDLALLDESLTSLIGAGIGQVGTLKPAMLTNIITMTLYQRYYPEMTGGENMDAYFQQQALLRLRSVKGLEAPESQIDMLLNSHSIERQMELLICMIKNLEEGKEIMDKLNAAYYAHDINALIKLFEDDAHSSCPSTEEEKNAINKDRNMKWLEKLPSIMQEKSSFIAVGSLHLPGEHGLIEGLRNLGYTVEAVK
jgi:uncharacterized protein YbaP (TraB family)